MEEEDGELLNLDSYLASVNSSSDEEEVRYCVTGSSSRKRRTLDEILLLDHNSSSESCGSGIIGVDGPTTIGNNISSSKNAAAAYQSRYRKRTSFPTAVVVESSSSVAVSSGGSLFGVRRRPPPSGVGGKPGAALAAAAAASRSVPTPHAASLLLQSSSSSTTRPPLTLLKPGTPPPPNANFISSSAPPPPVPVFRPPLGTPTQTHSQSNQKQLLLQEEEEATETPLVLEEEPTPQLQQQHQLVEEEESAQHFNTHGNAAARTNEIYDTIPQSIDAAAESAQESPAGCYKDDADDKLIITNLETISQHHGDGDDDAEPPPPPCIQDDIGPKDDLAEEEEEEEEENRISQPERKSASSSPSPKRAEKKKPVPPSRRKPLELAEQLEKKRAFTSLDLENDIAAQPMRLEGVRRGSIALGYFDVTANNPITTTLSSQLFRRDQGSPQVLAVHFNFIAVGLSKGLVLVLPNKYSPHSADTMDAAKMLMLGLQGDSTHPAVTSICFSQQGDLLFAGYSDGRITVWDLHKGSAVKVVTGIHDAPVVHLLYLSQDSQVTRSYRVVSGDSKGFMWLITFSVVPWVNRVSFSTTCLLDGQNTGKVLCASPLLPDEFCGGSLMSSQGNATGSSSGIGSVVGGVLGGDAGRKLLNEKSSAVEEGVVIFATYQSALVARVSPSIVVYAQLLKPDGIREGSVPYTAWKSMGKRHVASTDMPVELSEKVSLLAIAWDRKVQVAKLVKKELKIYGKWTLESSAIGVAWLDDEMLVVLTANGQLSLFAKDGTVVHQTSFMIDGSGGDDLIAYHMHFTNIFGNPEKAFHNCIAVRGATIYVLGPSHLIVCRLLPWKERIQVLRKAGDWMGALNMAMSLYDGQAHGVIDLPKALDAVHEAIMPYLVELLLSYVDEVFSYISVAFCNQIGKLEQLTDAISKANTVHSDIKEQFTRVGGVAVEFCVHIRRTDILFDDILSKFVAVQQKDTFLELLEPYILKDMLGSLPPEIMQALVEHYNSKGWLQRVEQCVLHMDISSLDFNQVVCLCREHRLYGALVYLFNRGLDDFRAPLEELLTVIQNSQREAAASLGYRMLIYLKYCFSGLNFPPGHGSIPASRLPSLRIELVQFLLETSNATKSCMVNKVSSSGEYVNLYHLLELDTEATLDVLRCAFAEDKIAVLDDTLHDLDNENLEAEKENDLVVPDQNVMVQKIVDALVQVPEKSTFQTCNLTGSGDVDIMEVWPSKDDIGHIFEFIAECASFQKAAVSSGVLNQILEYYTSKVNLLPSTSGQNADISRKREKQMLALLKSVPETDWNTSYVLHLCEISQFYQVCGFVHAILHHPIPALDCYMKDFYEPIHAFSFISDSLDKMSDAVAEPFRSAVLLRIPDLIFLSREDAFFLITHYFRGERQHILSELQSHPRSLFLYLKTVFEVHLSGTLNFSRLLEDENLELPSGKARDRSVEMYLRRISGFRKFLRDNPVQVTDEMIELYLQLLCQYERNSVLKFLETFENYRVEHCLRLCQEYGVIDASAFLLERVGDVGNALLLALSGLNEKFVRLDTAVGRIISDASVDHFSTILKETEVNDVRDILHACVGLCQRNTPRLDPEESESLWFQLLDSFCEPLIDSLTDKLILEGDSHAGPLAESFSVRGDDEANVTKWKISKYHRGAQILRKLFSKFIKEIVEGMIGFVHLPVIMSKLLADNSTQEFGDFKLTILGMLGTYGFERRILDTAKSLIEDDTFYTMSLLKKGASRGYAPRSLVCCICNCILTRASSFSSGIHLFSCGHAIHLQCEVMGSEISQKCGSAAGCPVCMPTKKGLKSKGKVGITADGLVTNSQLKRPQQSHGAVASYPHESEAAESLYGVQQISRFDILASLKKEQRLIQIENIPPLRLAPPAVYHEKVKKGINLLPGESSRRTAAVEKPSKSKHLRDIKLRGPSIRLPLKSNIFGKEKSSKG